MNTLKSTKPRMAENADNLCKTIKEATDKGIVSKKGYGILYPAVFIIGNEYKKYKISSKGIEIITDGGMGIRSATLLEENEIHDAIDKDIVQVVLMTRWGGSGKNTDSKILEVIHSPSGNSFKQKGKSYDF